MQTATVTLFYDTRRIAKDGSFVRLSVYADRQQKIYSTGQKVTADEWKFLLMRELACEEGYVFLAKEGSD